MMIIEIMLALKPLLSPVTPIMSHSSALRILKLWSKISLTRTRIYRLYNQPHPLYNHCLEVQL